MNMKPTQNLVSAFSIFKITIIFKIKKYAYGKVWDKSVTLIQN